MNRKRLTYANIVSTITKLCQKSGIKLVLNDPDVGKDNGFAYGANEIHLGYKYSTNLILLSVFFHEYSHALISRRKGRRYRQLSIFQEETMSWDLAMETQFKVFGRKFTKSHGNFMLDCLKTYSRRHYNFRKGYSSEEEIRS